MWLAIAAAVWLFAGLVIGLRRIDWYQAYVPRWQLIDRTGNVRLSSTRTGIALLMLSLATCWPYYLWAWRRGRLAEWNKDEPR